MSWPQIHKGPGSFYSNLTHLPWCNNPLMEIQAFHFNISQFMWPWGGGCPTAFHICSSMRLVQTKAKRWYTDAFFSTFASFSPRRRHRTHRTSSWWVGETSQNAATQAMWKHSHRSQARCVLESISSTARWPVRTNMQEKNKTPRSKQREEQTPADKRAVFTSQLTSEFAQTKHAKGEKEL